MTRRIVVIGGDAAGMSAASQAKRLLGDAAEIVVLERQVWTSYSACGIPYWIAGDVAGPDALIARTPEEHRRRGLDVRLRHEAVAIDVALRMVTVRDLDAGSEFSLDYDELVLGTGAVPVRPPIEGIDAEGVLGVQTIDDGAAVLRYLEGLEAKGSGPHRAVVIGGGYIGVEMAEAMKRHGLDVTLVDLAPEPMATLDPDMGRRVREAMVGFGCEVVTSAPVEAIETTDGRASAVTAVGRSFPADVVILGLGVRPATGLAAAAGIALGEFRGVLTDARQQVVDGEGRPVDGLWAGGDCVEVVDRITGRRAHIPLGTHANKQGRVIGTNLGGGRDHFPGVVRTAVSKVCELEIARSGLREKDATAAGLSVVTATVDSTSRAGYFPGADPMTVKVIAERGTGRLLGVQIVGLSGAAKRIDAAALALWNGMTAQELAMSDLAYAPPFSPVWDPVAIAARKAADAA
jgi:NADPH-dependent 2,4-dienoyl-CoA reductase/sulfur reductase-like enzyme